MTRFIDVGIARVNVAYIVRVEGHPDGSAEVYMIDGTMFRCQSFDFKELDGERHVVSVITCNDLDAVYLHEGAKVVLPIRHLCLTAAGKVVPILDYTALGDEDFGYDFLYYSER